MGSRTVVDVTVVVPMGLTDHEEALFSQLFYTAEAMYYKLAQGSMPVRRNYRDSLLGALPYSEASQRNGHAELLVLIVGEFEGRLVTNADVWKRLNDFVDQDDCLVLVAPSAEAYDRLTRHYRSINHRNQAQGNPGRIGVIMRDELALDSTAAYRVVNEWLCGIGLPVSR
jgi:hypothetical protein